MNTKSLMIASSFAMGIMGIVLSFLPNEMLTFLSISSLSGFAPIVLQILGALYFAFAMINWTAKNNLIGGIYARPIAIGNLTHFTIGALALIKGFFVTNDFLILSFAITYSIFAVLFGIVFFNHLVKS